MHRRQILSNHKRSPSMRKIESMGVKDGSQVNQKQEATQSHHLRKRIVNDSHSDGMKRAPLVASHTVENDRISFQSTEPKLRSKLCLSRPTQNSYRLSDSISHFAEVRLKLIEATILTDRANALANEQHRNYRYQVSLQVPISCLSQAKRGKEMIRCEPVIELKRGGIRVRSISLSRMEEKVQSLELGTKEGKNTSLTAYESILLNEEQSVEKIISSKGKVYRSKSDLVLIGVANIYLRCLLYVTEFSYLAPIITPFGEVAGRLLIELSASVLQEDNSIQMLSSSFPSVENVNCNRSDLPDLIGLSENESGSLLNIKVTLRHASGLSCAFSKMILCHFYMFCVSEPVVVLPKLESNNYTADRCKEDTLDLEQTQICTFDYSQTFQVKLNNEVIDKLSDSALSVEVYGNIFDHCLNNEELDKHQLQNNGSSVQTTLLEPRKTTTKLRRYKSDVMSNREKIVTSQHEKNMSVGKITEDWLKLQRIIDLWVSIEEPSEDGTYKKVAVKKANDVKTGGIYQLRQGLNRRIRVLIQPSALNRKECGYLPVVCENVNQVSVGCISKLTSETDQVGGVVVKGRDKSILKSPDSYQDIDLERLRQQWCDAMNKWQAYLQENLQLLAKKKEKTAIDEAREGYLLNRWVTSIQERDAVLLPSYDSGLPGALATGNPQTSVEDHNPLIFVDIQNDLTTNNQLLNGGANSFLDGEKSALKEGKQFVSMPLIKTYTTLTGAVASWDSSLHNEDVLNKISSPNERIYLIVKVNILLSKPTYMTVTLRKRICVTIGKRSTYANIFKSPFSRIISTEKNPVLWTGIAYKFITGIPQMSQHAIISPSKNNNEEVDVTTVEKSTEYYIEQYIKTIQDVDGEIYLDDLRQEVALQEMLSNNQTYRTSNDTSEYLRKLRLSEQANNSPPSIVRSKSCREKSAPSMTNRNFRPRQSRNTTSILKLPSNNFANQDSYLLDSKLSTDFKPLTMENSIRKQSSSILTNSPTDHSNSEKCINLKSFEKDKSEDKMAWRRREREKQSIPKL